MSSIAELKVVRLYRAYNTIIQMCMDRGFKVRHPSAVAQAVSDPCIYNDEDGLSYDWFLQHYVANSSSSSRGITEETACEEEMERNGNGHQQVERTWLPTYGAMRLVWNARSDTADEKSAHKNGEKGKVMVVFFSGSSSLSMSEVQECRDKALQKHACCMIIVSAGKIAPAVRRGARELSGRFHTGEAGETMSIQLFEEDALAYNIARNETVPLHMTLSPAMAHAFLQSRDLKLSQLPRILDDDPMVGYLGLSRGSIVKIQRATAESGPYEMYRQVV